MSQKWKTSDLIALQQRGMIPREVPLPQEPARQKYGAKASRNEQTGERFDSQKERRRWAVLKLLEREGKITGLQRQVSFEIVVNGCPICLYVADHVYTDGEGRQVVEDVKSEATRKIATYKLKKKLMLAVFGITITEV